MYNLISKNFMGATVTIGITGIPLTISGEVVRADDKLIGLRLPSGLKVFVDSAKVAFFF